MLVLKSNGACFLTTSYFPMVLKSVVEEVHFVYLSKRGNITSKKDCFHISTLEKVLKYWHHYTVRYVAHNLVEVKSLKTSSLSRQIFEE